MLNKCRGQKKRLTGKGEQSDMSVDEKDPRSSKTRFSNIRGRQQAGGTGTRRLFINRCSLLVDYWPGIPLLIEGTHAIPIPFVYPVVASSFAPMQKKRHVMISFAFRPCVQSIYPPENRNADQCRKRLLTPKLVFRKEVAVKVA